MASCSPGDDGNFFCIGLTPRIETKTPEEKECLLASFYQFLREFNSDPMLIKNMNTELHIKLSKIHVGYSTGDQFVTCKFSSKNMIEIGKLQKCLENNSLSNFMTEYFESIGLNISLGLDINEKVNIHVVPIRIETQAEEESQMKSNTDEKNTTEVVPILIRVYVPYEVRKIKEVTIVWKNNYCKTQNIPGTLLWTVEITTSDLYHEFYVEVSFLKSSGIWIFKEVYEEKIKSSLIQDGLKNPIYHLVFPYQEPEIYDNAFVAFCTNILKQEIYKNKKSAVAQLEAMSGNTTLHIGLSVTFSGIVIHNRAKDIVSSLIKSISDEISTSTIPAISYILYHIVGAPNFISRLNFVDQKMAEKFVENFKWLQPEEFLTQHLDKIGVVFQQLYMSLLADRACLVGFISHTLCYLKEDFLIKLVNNSVANKESFMPLYVASQSLKTENVLLKVLQESKTALLEKILRHLPHLCAFDEYISVINVLLKNAEEQSSIKEKLVDSCRQKCTHLIKGSDLNNVLDIWKAIQTLDPIIYVTLQPVIEKGILESLSNEVKHANFDRKGEFVQAILGGSIFALIDRKIDLLKHLATLKRALHTCVPDLLSNEQFHSLPDDSISQIVKQWTQNTLQIDKNRSAVERVVRAYHTLYLVLQLPPVQRIESLQKEIDEVVLKTIEQVNIKELMKAVPDVEENEQLHKLFQSHLRTILHGKHSKKRPADIIKDICGRSQLRVRSRLTTNILMDIMDLLGICESDSHEEVFFKAVEHSVFWKEIFNAEGNDLPIQTLQNHGPCLKVADSIFYLQKILENKKISYSLIQRLKNKQEEMLMLLSCTGKKDPDQMKNCWMKCYNTSCTLTGNIKVICDVLSTIKAHVKIGYISSAVGNALEFLEGLQNDIEKGDIFVEKTSQNNTLNTYILEMAEYCTLLNRPMKSKVFWNILKDELKTNQIWDTTENIFRTEDDLNSGMCLAHLFGENVVEEEVKNSKMIISSSMTLVSSISTSCVEKYKQVWTPYFKRENKPLDEFKKMFAKVKTTEDMINEIKVAEEFCNNKISSMMRSTLLKFADLTSYVKTVEAVTNATKVFKFSENIDTCNEVVSSFYKLFKVKKKGEEDLKNVFLKDMETVLERVEEIRQLINTEVIEILEVLKSATLLLSFLNEVIDEDIRNLIDAVEEHSEQYVRESTVLDFIEIKSFFYPILKKTYGDKFTDFFSFLKKQLNSEFTNMPGKIQDCMDNLHTLRALYKNVANRGERTKEIIDNIISRGRFSFHMDSQVCEIVVKYKQGKKAVSHKSADLSDLRSRALLLMNAEDKEKIRPKTGKKDLEKFLHLVDTAFNIADMCCKLKQSGHFDYSRYDQKCEHKELDNQSKLLANKHLEWTTNISLCRERYYYMNFIYPTQLQQIFQYLCRGYDNEKQVLHSLQFINCSFENAHLLKESFMSLPHKDDNYGILHNIAQTLQNVFEGYIPKETTFLTVKKKAKITDIVQEGVPYIVALDEGSPLVVRTIFALYMKTTNKLPNASQVLLCRNGTTFDDIDLFLRRCTGDTQKGHLYCISNVEKLSNDVQSRFVENIHNLPSGTYLLSVICCGHAHHHPFLDQFGDRLNYPTPMTDKALKDCFRSHWKDVFVVTSDIPGLGKTELIKKKAREKGMSVATLHISGKVDMQSLISTLNTLNLRKYHVLHIDIGISSSPSDLDSVLFQLIVLGHLSTGSASYTLVNSHVFIEIPNTVGQSLCNALPTTTCFPRVNINWKNYSDMNVSMEVNSPVQVVCHYLKALDSGIIDKTDIYFTGTNVQHPLKSEECIDLLNRHFSTTGDVSYTLLQSFINVLSDQLKKLSASVFFRTANIAEMVGDKTIPNVKSNLVQALINTSQEFASRSVLSCRSLQTASLVSTHEKVINNINSAEELSQRVAGMIRWEDSNHLMVLFHQNFQTVSALYRDKFRIPRSIQILFESQMKKELDDFKSKTQRQLQDILQMLTRSVKLSDRFLEDLAVNYALTPDNLLKMTLISLRVNSHIPVVIMGETGCGKTSLIRYLADISENKFEILSIHAGISENIILKKVQEVNDAAMSHLDVTYWLFLDEINTCDHLGIISNIICHRYYLDTTLSPNLTVIAACNPYRLRTQSAILTAGLQGKSKTDELSRLVYRVHPLPESLIDFVWDYGSLNENDEKLYISKMVKGVFDDYFKPLDYETLFTNLLAMSQNLVRTKETTDSCISLRDVDRCKKLVIWFLQYLHEKKTKTSYEYGVEMKAIILGLAVSYHSRFANIETRRLYREYISHYVSRSFPPINSKTILEIILEEQNDILNRMVLPNGIAKNAALQENVFVVLVCILNKIPIFLVGKPGCSKSLSMQLIRSNLRGRDSKNQLFQTMPQLFCVSFQGSESSTSDGIIKVFDKAENYQKHNEKDVLSVVILDEIGLAEVSRFNPLKVLHGLLEPGNRQNPNVAVVGISNWALDAAKMNRAVHLSRPDMDLEELKYTGYSISQAIVQEMHDEEFDSEDTEEFNNISIFFKHVFDEVAVAYYKYVTERQKFENFHGLRDYYSLVKYIGRCSGVLKAADENLQSEIILKGIARNFGGLPTELGGIVEKFKESFPSLKHKSIAVTDLIKDNLDDESCRHLMLITNGDSVVSVLESHLNGINRPFEIIFGSHFEDDLSDEYNYRILSRIILCMEQGLVLILKGLESIYGSLYDMLNQNYTVVGNKKNCRIALGQYSNPMCHVHDSFKCIVLVEEKNLDYSDPPFLNRFEKQQFRFSDLVDSDKFKDIVGKIEETLEMLCHIEGCLFCPENVIPSYSRDMLVSLILYLKNKDIDDISNDNYFIDTALQLIMWTFPPEVVLRSRESRLFEENPCFVEKMIETYMKLPLHDGLSDGLDSLLNFQNEQHPQNAILLMDSINKQTMENAHARDGKLLLIYTYTNIHVNIRNCFNTHTHQIEKLASFKSEKQFSNKVEDFFASERNVLLLQCSATHHSQHLLLCKVIIGNCHRKNGSQLKHVCMIIHLDRDLTHEQQYVPINYLSGWKIIFIDSLERPATSITHFLNFTKYEIVQQRRPLDVYIVENLFWALTRIKFTTRNNSIENQKQWIVQLRTNEVAIHTIEQLITGWIQEQTTEESQQWCIEVAKNTHDLYKSGSFVGACENTIHDFVKTPLAMYLYQMLEKQILSPVFVNDDKSIERIDVWTKIILSEVYTSVKDMPPVTGPECYSCRTPFLYLKMPLSQVLMDKINTQKDEFIQIVRKLQIQHDLELDEDIPTELFIETVSKCMDIICCDVDDIYNVQYPGREEDYLHDFCSVHCCGLTITSDQDKARNIFTWALSHFMHTSEIHKDDLIHVMASVHAAFWLNAHVISSICHLLELSEQVINIPWDQFSDINMLLKERKIENEEKKISAMTRMEFVDYLCIKLLPTTTTVDHFNSFLEWVDFVQDIVPVAKIVSYESIIMPSLQLCQEIIALVVNSTNCNFESVLKLGEMFQENGGQINSPEAFNLIIDILNNLQATNLDFKPRIQRFFCYYISRCLHSYPDDCQVLNSVLDMILEGSIFDINLSYFGKCLDFVVMLESSGNKDFIKDVILDSASEMPPFIECLDNFLQNLDLTENKVSILPSLLVDVIQKSCFKSFVQMEDIDSASHHAINCLSEAFNMIGNNEISFRYIAAISFLKQFMQTYFQTLVQYQFDSSKFMIAVQYINTTLSAKCPGMKEPELNPLLIYLMKLFVNFFGMEHVYKCCKHFQNTLTRFDSIEWNSVYIEKSIVLNPLVMYLDPFLEASMRKQISQILEKENSFAEFLEDNPARIMMLFGILSQCFYMRRYLRELSDDESRMGKEIGTIIKSSKLPDKYKHMAKYFIGDEFGHDIFSLSEASEAPTPQLVSLILHLCCLISTASHDTSLWYANFYHPNSSSVQFFPCCKTIPSTHAETKVLQLLNICTVIGSIGFHFTTSDALQSIENNDDCSSDLQGELETLFHDLHYILQMNYSELCVLLHFVIKKCEVLITQGSSYMELVTTQNKLDLQDKFIRIIKEILSDRWKILHDLRKGSYSIDNNPFCIEAAIEEIVKPLTLDVGTAFTYCMFRVSRTPTKEMLLTEFQLTDKNEFTFLNLVFQDMRKLSIPQYIPLLLRWHMSVVAYASYKFRKVEFRDLTVHRFFSEEIDDKRRNILKKNFDQFKKAWNEIRENFMEDLPSIKMEPMNQMTKMVACTICNDDSSLLTLLKALVEINNTFLEMSVSATEKNQTKKSSNISSNRKISVLDVGTNDVVKFVWNNDWLIYSQCETDYGLGRSIMFDFKMIETEIKKDLLFGKVKIEFPHIFPKPVFMDDLFQNSVELLSEIELVIPQHQLTNEIRKSVEIKVDRDASFVTDLLTHLGMVLALLRKTGGENSLPLIEYLEKWQSVTGMNSNVFKRILPEPLDSVKLEHVVTLYKWLEELNGASLVETLDETYHKRLPPEGKDMLMKMKELHMNHLEKLIHPLLIFVHRCLSTKKTNISTEHPLVDYIKSQDLWWKDDFNNCEVVAGSDKKSLPLDEMLSPLVLIEHVTEAVLFIQEAVKEAKECDVRIANISSEFQKMKKTQPNPNTRKTTARRIIKF